jgi:hypothetical protein
MQTYTENNCSNTQQLQLTNVPQTQETFFKEFFLTCSTMESSQDRWAILCNKDRPKLNGFDLRLGGLESNSFIDTFLLKQSSLESARATLERITEKNKESGDPETTNTNQNIQKIRKQIKTKRTQRNSYYNSKKDKYIQKLKQLQENSSVSQSETIKNIISFTINYLKRETPDSFTRTNNTFRSIMQRIRTKVSQYITETYEITQYDDDETQEFIIYRPERGILLDRSPQAPQTIECIKNPWKEPNNWRTPELSNDFTSYITEIQHRIFSSRKSYEYYTYRLCGTLSPINFVTYRKRDTSERTKQHAYLVARQLYNRWDNRRNVINSQ